MSFAELVELERNDFAQQFITSDDPAGVPSFSETKYVCSMAARDKAVGDDGVPGEVYKEFPEEMAVLVHPLMV